MGYTELEKMNFRACCELIAKHAKNPWAVGYAQQGMRMKNDQAILDQCEYILGNIHYERKWVNSRFTPKEARQTLKKMIQRGKHI